MRIGFLGVGTIAEALIRGFEHRGDGGHSYYLSPRNVLRVAGLCKDFRACVACDSNQAVVDACDVIIISLKTKKPLETVEALKGLKFRKDQHIINVVGSMPVEDIKEACGAAASFSHVIALPSVRLNYGPILVCSQTAIIGELFEGMGDLFFIDDIGQIKAMQAVTGLMAGFYAMMQELSVGLQKTGVSGDTGALFLSSFFGALCRDIKDGDFEGLMDEMTPGGLNMFALEMLEDKGAIKGLSEIMGRVVARLE